MASADICFVWRQPVTNQAGGGLPFKTDA